MITEKAIQEAIAYYQGKLDPKRDDAAALAACYIIQDHMYATSYSYAAPPELLEGIPAQRGEDFIGAYGDSEFLQAIKGKSSAEIWPIMDELMEDLKILNARIYNSVMQRIR